MTNIRRTVVTAAVLTPFVATAWIGLAGLSSFEISCGPSAAGAATPLVVQLLDPGTPRHGSMTLKTKRQNVSDEIDVDVNILGLHPMCGAMAPGQFHVQGTAAFLQGRTMTVATRTPIRVEIQDSMKRVLTSEIVDPASTSRTAISW